MKFIKLDANETLFFARELEQIKAKTYDKKYPMLKSRMLIPVSGDVNTGAETITYEQYDMVGMAKIVESYAKDFPRADVVKAQFTSKVKSLGDSYGYSVQDVRAAIFANVPLVDKKASAARKMIAIKEDQILAFGDTAAGLPGFLTNANIPAYVLPNDGTGASRKFINKTEDQILRDLNGMVNSVVSLTNGVEYVDTILLPDAVFGDLNTRRIANTSISILEYFLAKNSAIKSIEPWYKLKGAGAGGTDKIFMYRRDPEVVEAQIPQEFEQFPPQEEGMEFVVNCHSRTGGTLWYYPLAAVYGDDC
jgi:hypothetical protein